MEVKSSIRVGILAVIGLIIGLYLLFYLSHYNPNSYTITVYFENTLGLTTQSIVRMQGVSIGEVKSITLDTLRTPAYPKVELSIDKKYRIPSNYRFRIISGLLITTPQINVVPPVVPAQAAFLPEDGSAHVKGEPILGPLASLSPELNESIGQLPDTLTHIQKEFDTLSDKLGKLADDTDKLVRVSTSTMQTANKFVSNPDTQRNLQQTVSNFKEASAETASTAAHLNVQLTAFLNSGRHQFDQLSGATTELIVKLGNTVDDARAVVQSLTQQVSDPRLQQSLHETIDLARSTLASVRQITSDLHQITGDPALASGVRETVSNLSAASEKTKSAMDKVNSILDKLDATGRKGPLIKLPKTSLKMNVSEQINPGKFRVDVDSLFQLGHRRNIDLGLYDLGADTRLNLLMGLPLSNDFMVHYGLYAGSIGTALDYGLSKQLGLRAYFYNTHHPRLDVRALYRVNNDTSIWIGSDGIFSHAVPIAGVEVRSR